MKTKYYFWVAVSWALTIISFPIAGPVCIIHWLIEKYDECVICPLGYFLAEKRRKALNEIEEAKKNGI